MAKKANKSNSHSFPDSSNTKLLNILLTILASVFIGFITYLCTRDKMNPGDRKLCKTILWVFFIIEAIAIAGYIVLYFFLPKWVPINEFF